MLAVEKLNGSLVILIFFVLISTTGSHAQFGSRQGSFGEVLEYVRSPKTAFGNLSDSELQVHYRLKGVSHFLNYEDGFRDEQRWLEVLNDANEGVYAKVCAAYFVSHFNNEARDFLKSLISSDNIRHRYNAAEAVRLSLENSHFYNQDGDSEWGANVLLEYVSNGYLYDKGVEPVTFGHFPEGDCYDLRAAPVNRICRDLGLYKYQRAVPILIKVLEKEPSSWGAAFALGETGDRDAVPVLMKVFKEGTGSPKHVPEALAKLDAREAVPELVSRLFTTGVKSDEKVCLLEALHRFGGDDVAESIRDYIDLAPNDISAAAARRISALLDYEAPVVKLLNLLEHQSYEPEKAALVKALAGFSYDERAFTAVTNIARNSDSAYMRQQAIDSLGAVNSYRSLTALVDLLDIQFPRSLKNVKEVGMVPYDPNTYFQRTILAVLKKQTGRELPGISSVWKVYLDNYRK